MSFTYMHMRQKEREVPAPLSSRVRKHVGGRSNRREAFAALNESGPLTVAQRLTPKYMPPSPSHPTPYKQKRPASAQVRGGSGGGVGARAADTGEVLGGGTPRSSRAGSRPQSASPRVSVVGGAGGGSPAARVGAASGSGAGGGGSTVKRPYSAHPSVGRVRSSGGDGGGGGGGDDGGCDGGSDAAEATSASSSYSPRPGRPTGPPPALPVPYSLDHDYHTGDWPGLRPARPAHFRSTSAAPQPQPRTTTTSARVTGATTASAVGNPGDVRRQLRERLTARGIKSGQVFVFFNRDRMGGVSKRAFREGLERLAVTSSAEAADALFHELDVKRDGTLDHSELATAASMTTTTRQQQRPQSAVTVSASPRPPTVSAMEREARRHAALFTEPESQRRPGSALPAASSAGYRRPTSAPAHRLRGGGGGGGRGGGGTAYASVSSTAAGSSSTSRGIITTSTTSTTNPSPPPDDAERAAVFRQVIKRKLEERGKGDREAFHFFDCDKDGKINHAEFKRALEGLNLGISSEDAAVVFEKCRAEAAAAMDAAETAGGGGGSGGEGRLHHSLYTNNKHGGRAANGYDPDVSYAPMCTLAGGRPGEYQGGVGEGAEPPPDHLSLTTTRERAARAAREAVTAKVGARVNDDGGGVGGGSTGGSMDYHQFRAAFMTPDVVTTISSTTTTTRGGGGNAMERVWNEERKLTPSEVYAATFTGKSKSGGGGRIADGGDGSGPPHGFTRRIVDGSEQAKRVTWSPLFCQKPLSLDPTPSHYAPARA